MRILRAILWDQACTPLSRKKLSNMECVAKRFFTVQAAPALISNAKRSYSVTSVDPLEHYAQCTYKEQISCLLKTGLHRLGNTLEDTEQGWNRLVKNIGLTNYSPNVEKNLENIIPLLERYNSVVQANQIIEDMDEATWVIRSKYRPLQSLVPSLQDMDTCDAQYCFELIEKQCVDGTFLLEDGSGNGNHLLQFASYLKKQRCSFYALGTDVNSREIVLAQLATEALGLNEVCKFLPAHALHRASHRNISLSLCTQINKHIIIACRLIPVFTETKIKRYFEKLSTEMSPGDLWCGSIALPEGNLYDKHTKNNMQALKTLFGAKTLVHSPGGLNTEEEKKRFNEEIAKLDLKNRSPGDFERVILNTYMTLETFEKLINSYGFKLAKIKTLTKEESPHTRYFCALLEKMQTPNSVKTQS